MPGSDIPMSGNPVGGGSTLNTQIPMAGAQAVQPVKPMGAIDINAAQAKAAQERAISAQARQISQQQDDADHDRLIIDQYKKSGGKGDLVTPDGIMQTLNDLKGQLSSTGYNNLSELYGKKKTADLQYQEVLAKTDKAKLEQMSAGLDFEQGFLNAPRIEAYKKVWDETHDLDKAKAAYADATQVAVEMASKVIDPSTGKPKYPQQKLDAFKNLTYEQADHLYEATDYAHQRIKDAFSMQKTAAEADAAAAKAEFLRKRASGAVEGAKMESKTMLVDGEVAQVNFHSTTGRYTLPTGEDVTAIVKPIEKGGLTPVQMGTVEKDIFEAKKFLERTKPGQTSSLFFLDQSPDKSALRRFTENKMTTQESQLYDLYANRLANAIVGMQSLGRYRGAVKSIDEARKMVPAPGDTEATIKAKRDYIEEFTRDSDDELSKLMGGRKREKLMQDKLNKTKPVSTAPELDPETLKLLDEYAPGK